MKRYVAIVIAVIFALLVITVLAGMIQRARDYQALCTHTYTFKDCK